MVTTTDHVSLVAKESIIDNTVDWCRRLCVAVVVDSSSSRSMYWSRILVCGIWTVKCIGTFHAWYSISPPCIILILMRMHHESRGQSIFGAKSVNNTSTNTTNFWCLSLTLTHTLTCSFICWFLFPLQTSMVYSHTVWFLTMNMNKGYQHFSAILWLCNRLNLISCVNSREASIRVHISIYVYVFALSVQCATCTNL